MKFKFHSNLTKKQVRVYRISLSSLRIRNYSNKCYREIRNTISYSKNFLPISWLL